MCYFNLRQTEQKEKRDFRDMEILNLWQVFISSAKMRSVGRIQAEIDAVTEI